MTSERGPQVLVKLVALLVANPALMPVKGLELGAAGIGERMKTPDNGGVLFHFGDGAATDRRAGYAGQLKRVAQCFRRTGRRSRLHQQAGRLYLHGNHSGSLPPGYGQNNTRERQTMDVCEIQRDQNRIEMEAFEGLRQHCRVVVAGDSQMPYTAFSLRLQQCVNGALRGKNLFQLGPRPYIVELPEVEPIRAQTA